MGENENVRKNKSNLQTNQPTKPHRKDKESKHSGCEKTKERVITGREDKENQEDREKNKAKNIEETCSPSASIRRNQEKTTAATQGVVKIDQTYTPTKPDGNNKKSNLTVKETRIIERDARQQDETLASATRIQRSVMAVNGIGNLLHTNIPECLFTAATLMTSIFESLLPNSNQLNSCKPYTQPASQSPGLQDPSWSMSLEYCSHQMS